jgi:hypothetical protein
MHDADPIGAILDLVASNDIDVVLFELWSSALSQQLSLLASLERASSAHRWCNARKQLERLEKVSSTAPVARYHRSRLHQLRDA